MVLDVLAGGIAGGLVGTLLMKGIMMAAMGDEPAPSQIAASKFVNDRPPEQNMGLGMVLHLTYGTLAGLLLVALAALGGFAGDLLPAAVWGLFFGVVLWFATLTWLGLLGTLSEWGGAPPEQRRKNLGAALGMHLLYGLVVGLVGAFVVSAL